jgi:hypothetical protein
MRIFFPIPKICNDLTEKTKLDLLWAVDRSSPDKKVVDFIEQFSNLEAEMKHQQRLKQMFLFRLLHHFYVPQQRLMFLLAVIVNLLLVSSFGLNDDGRQFVQREVRN